MENSAIDLLNRWFKFTNFNEKPKNLLSAEYDIHRANEKAMKINNEYDPTGTLALIYLYGYTKRLFKTASYSIESLSNYSEEVAEAVHIYRSFNSGEVADIRNQFMAKIDKIAQQVAGTPLIGERDLADCEKDLLGSIDAIVEEFGKLKFELYKKGGELGKIENFCSNIKVFDSLAKCILTLEKCPNLICLCYIANGGTADGYFGYFISNNGNLFSMNERIDEVYVGQHRRLRNGRWTEGKAASVFPYDDLFSFFDHDYRGYATHYEIDQERLHFSKFSHGVMMKIVISMAILMNKYNNGIIEAEPVVLDSLLPVNLKAIDNQGECALIKVSDSAIVASNSAFNLRFNREEFLSGKLNAKFDSSNKSRNWSETGHFSNYGQIFVDTYGEDFQYDENELLASNSSRRLIGDAEANFEFVGSKNRMELQAYYKLRKKLADFIRDKQDAEFAEFGGVDALRVWYLKALNDKFPKILEICKTLYREHYKREEVDRSIYPTFVADLTNCTFDKKRPGEYCLNLIGERKYDGSFICPVNGCAANCFFTFHPKNWIDVTLFIDQSVPKFTKGWENDRYGKHYSGNCLLDATDAVGELETPINRSRNRSGMIGSFSFDFQVALSKLALIKKG
jgi:hypothetical protein